MARLRNEETVDRVSYATRKLMLTKGYDEVSYSMIAAESGIARTTVQHYFPKKDQFAFSITQDMGDACTARAVELVGEEANPFAVMHVSNQLGASAYYATPGSARYLLDVTKKRELISQLLELDYSVLLRSVEYDGTFTEATASDEAIISIGGTYELHYVCLLNGRVPDFGLMSRTVDRVIAEYLGIERAQYEAVFDAYTLDNEALISHGKAIVDSLLCETPEEYAARRRK